MDQEGSRGADSLPSKMRLYSAHSWCPRMTSRHFSSSWWKRRHLSLRRLAAPQQKRFFLGVYIGVYIFWVSIIMFILIVIWFIIQLLLIDAAYFCQDTHQLPPLLPGPP